MINLSTDSEKKNFYMFCLSHVPDYKEGYMLEPLLADGYCRCLTDILELAIERPSNKLIVEFAESPQAEVVKKCPRPRS